MQYGEFNEVQLQYSGVTQNGDSIRHEVLTSKTSFTFRVHQKQLLCQHCH